MFNIGMGELLFIVLLALVVVGPERLPKIMREFGRFVRQARVFINEFTSQFSDELQSIQELQQPLQEFQQLADEINPVKQMTKMSVQLDAKERRKEAAQKGGAGPATDASKLVKPSAPSSKPRPAANPMQAIARAQKANFATTPSDTPTEQ